MSGAAIGRVALVVAAICVATAPSTLWGANDKTMNWCGWRVSNTSTADASRDLTTFRNWFATDNPYGNSDGYWWNEGNMTTATSGAWVNPRTLGKQILVQWNQGGCGYVNTVITNVCDLRLGISQSYKSVLRIDEGGCISNVNIQVGSVVDSLTGKNARLHINGGDVFVGNDNIANYGQKGLNISYAKTGEGGVFMTGGRLVVDKAFTIGANAGGVGCFALTNGTVESAVTVKVGPTATSNSGSARIIQAGGTFKANKGIIINTGGSYVMDGGTLEITSTGNDYLSVATTDGYKGVFALTNGTLVTWKYALAGSVVYKPVSTSDGRIIVAGGEWMAHNNISARNGGTVELTGGAVDTRMLQVICGGTIRMSGGYVKGGISFYNQGRPSDTSNELNVTNTFYLTGGTLVTTNVNMAIDGNGETIPDKGWLNGRSPARFVQTGGVHTNSNFWAGSGHSRYEISGGKYWVNRTWLGGLMPFYFRIQGTPTVSSLGWASNGAAANPDNCLIEHVIDERGLAPITFRSANYRQAHGHQRLRPLGGVQLVTTNFFPLFRFNRGTTVANRTLRSNGGTAGGKVCWGTWPDASLWTLDPFDTVLPASRDAETVSGLGSAGSTWGSQDGTYYDVGCTLNAAAEKGALTKAGAELTFEAVPMGYVKWPNRAKGKATSAQVSMKISAPEGGTLADALAKVCDGLEEAGYEDVAADAQADWNVTFTVPGERIPERNPNAALIFDFTETHVPAAGLTVDMTASDLVTVTNALVSGVSCKYDHIPGFMVIFR